VIRNPFRFVSANQTPPTIPSDHFAQQIVV
jgi:hypothetical protein